MTTHTDPTVGATPAPAQQAGPLQTPLRILMIAPTPFFADRGCHVRIYEEARELTERGHEVHLCTYHLGQDVPDFPIHRTLPVPWYHKLEAGPSWQKPFLDLLLFFTALRAGRRLRPHLVYAHLHEGACLAIPLVRLLGCPLVMDYQGSLLGEIEDHGFLRPGSLLGRFFGWLEGWIERRADLVVANGEAAAERLRDGLADGAVAVVADAVDQRTFAPRPADPELRRRLAIPPDRQVVVFLGLLNNYQGVDVLLEAMSVLVRRRPATHLLLMGYPNIEHYRAVAKDRGLADHVTFTGRVPYFQAAAYLSLGDVAVAPKLSATEANGKVLDYMACGLPVVTFDRPVDRELLGETGVFVPPGDHEALAAALGRLLDDPEACRRRGEAGRQRVLEHFSWRPLGNRLETTLRALTKETS